MTIIENSLGPIRLGGNLIHKNKRPSCTLLSVGSMAFCCILSTFIVMSHRKVNTITLSVDEDITSFVGRDNYTPSDMIVAAQEHAQKTVGLWGSSRLGSLSATLKCSDQNCELQELTTHFTPSPHFNFFFWRDDFPFLEYIFRIPNNEVLAHTYPNIWSRSKDTYTSWEDINVSLDEIIQIAPELENIGNDILVSWGWNSRWRVIGLNEGTTSYYVDDHSGVISQDYR